MEQLLLSVWAAWLRAGRRGRQVGHLLLEEMRVRLSVRMRVCSSTQAAVDRLGRLLLLRRRGGHRQLMERCVDSGSGSVLYLLLLLMMRMMMMKMMLLLLLLLLMLMLSLHTIAMVMVQAGV